MDTGSDNQRIGKKDRSLEQLLLRSVGIAVVVGGLATAIWFAIADLSSLGQATSRIDPVRILAAPLLTLVYLAIRFVRWHFLLRSINVFIPIRANVRVFLAGLSMVVTPLYAGEFIKAAWLRSIAGVPVRYSASVVVTERILDVAAIGILVAATANGSARYWILPVIILAVLVWTAVSMDPVGVPQAERLDRSRSMTSRMRTWLHSSLTQLHPRVFAGALCMSLAAWTCAAAVLWLVVGALGATMDPRTAIGIFSESTLLGGLTLLPGGVGVTGSLMVHSLEINRVAAADATVAVLLTRLSTLWFSAGVGLVSLVGIRRFLANTGNLDQADHFVDIADGYADEIPEHLRQFYLDKKIDRMLPYIDGRKGVDVGCGQAWYLRELENRGMEMRGFDLSEGQIANARQQFPDRDNLAVADCRNLPVDDNSADFAYCINILHHVTEEGGQQDALREMIRIVRPGGRVFIHEINTLNPAMKVYMGYVFPLLRSIDLGDERWIAPYSIPLPDNAELEVVEFFTFVPDFAPIWLLNALEPLEKILERSFLRTYSAHYMAVIRKKT